MSKYKRGNPPTFTKRPEPPQQQAAVQARAKKFFATYNGPHRELTIIPEIGKVIPGKKYAVSKSVADCLRHEPDWAVTEE